MGPAVGALRGGRPGWRGGMWGSAALLGALLLLLLSPGFLETSQYHYSEVIIPKRLLRRSGFNAEKEISYLIRIAGINRIVHLQQKSFIIANMPFYTFNRKGERLVDHPYIQDDCYYAGYVEDFPGSDVILSTCTGLWGHIQIGSLMYEIQPIENSSTFQHLIHQTAPKQHEPCGGILEDQDEWESNELGNGNAGSPVADPSSERLMNDPGDAAIRYLEYYVVCDSSMYQWENRNETRVILLMLQIISDLHNIYEGVGLRIILIGMELWKERDFTAISQKKLAKTLERFYNYATFELQRQVHFDHATLYTHKGEEGSFGMSWGDRLCLHNHVSVSAVKTSSSATHSGLSAAHELGHSLGFAHDDLLGGNVTGCDCNCISQPGRCVMYSGVVECRRLSNCSEKAYYELLQKPGKNCLQNQPKETAAKNKCGNGVVEGNEECDCGSFQEFEGASTLSSSRSGIPAELENMHFSHYLDHLEYRQPTELGGPVVETALSGGSIAELRGLNECRKNGCCQSNCTLKHDADCLYGLCCKECKFAEQGMLCRKAATDCDLPEYCTGASADCLADVNKQDGAPCGTDDSCFMGKCSDTHQHCRAVFGKGAKRAPLSCFRKVNMRGDRTGNCGEGKFGFKKCEEEHVLCGRIQCTNIGRIPVLPTGQAILQTPAGNIWCWGIGFHKGLNVNDIGATPDGSTCGIGKICLNRSCVNLGVLKDDCDSNKCNNRGVCNNRRNCHCAYGWAPPFCEGKGYGGSVDSGPPPKYQTPTNIIIGSTIGALCFLLTLALIMKYVKSRLTRIETPMDSDTDDTQPITEETQEKEAPPLKKPSEKTIQEAK